MSSLGRGNTPVQRLLAAFWDTIDISENIKRAENKAREHQNGPSAWMNFGAMLVMAVVCAALAWRWDIESTLIGMSTLRETMLADLPASVMKFSTIIAVCLTVAPTIVEMFTAAFAKADIKIVQIYIIAFTIFDTITDIPRSITFTNQMQANFDQLGMFSGIAYWIFFCGWLFLATIGFELGLVIFGWLTIVYFFKAMATEQPTRSVKGFGGGGGGGVPKQTVVDVGEKINVVN